MSKILVTSVLKLKLENGTNEKGEKAYTSRSWKNVSKDVSDDDFLDIGNSLAAMQTMPLAEVIRIDTDELTA